MTLEYYNQNALRKYPFRDTCSLVSSSAVALPDDCIVDGQVVMLSGTRSRAYLATLVKSGDTVTLQLGLINQDGGSLQTINVTGTISTMAEHDILTATNNYAAARFVVGPGMKDWLLSASRNLTFSDSELACSTVLPQPTSVVLTVTNTGSNNLPEVLTQFDNDNPLTLHPGSNLVTGLSGPAVTLSVTAGAGTGKYNGCGAIPAAIRLVNGQGPDQFGSFQMQADACYNRTTGAGFIAFANTCLRDCTVDDYRALAFYLNRLQQASNTLTNFSLVAKTDFDTAAAAVAARITHDQRYRPPYLKFDHLPGRYVKYDYESCTVGIHLPNKTKTSGALAVTLGSQMTVVDRSASLNIDNVPVLQSAGPGFSALQLNCKANIYQKFVLKTPKMMAADGTLLDVWNPNAQDGGYSVEGLLTHSTGQAYFYSPLFKRNCWFTVTYTYHLTGSAYLVNFEITFSDSENRELNTFFHMQLPNGLAIMQGTLKLWVNNTVVSVDPSIQHVPGWGTPGGAGVLMNFGKKNRLTFSCLWGGDECSNIPLSNGAITLDAKLVTNDIDGSNWTFTNQFQINFAEPV